MVKKTKNKKEIIIDRNQLMWKYKLIFFKYLSIFLFVLTSLTIIIIKGIKFIELFFIMINEFILYTLSSFWFIISTWYITLIIALIVFFYRNKLYINKLTENEIKEKKTDDIFILELWLFVSTMFYINFFTMWKIIFVNELQLPGVILGVITFFVIMFHTGIDN